MHSYTGGIFRRTSHVIARSTPSQCYAPSWKTNFEHASVKTIDLEFLLTRLHVHCYSSGRSTGRKTSQRRKLDSEPEPVMDKEKDAFFVVRKGDIVGIYKSLADCQAQVGSSVCDPPVSVYKGYSLSKDTEEYLVSYGLKKAIYAIRASDVKEDLFGTLTPCQFHEPASSKFEPSTKNASKKRSKDMLDSENVEKITSGSISIDPLKKVAKLEGQAEAQTASSHDQSCILEFDGASRGNPGLAGAAAVLRADDGSVICKLREGLGTATCNVAEYRGIILGLKHALQKGYTSIHVKGDSKLVCMQMQGLWKVKNETLSQLYKEAKKLKDKFLSFQINHVLREFNSVADAQANLAIKLADGQVQEELA